MQPIFKLFESWRTHIGRSKVSSVDRLWGGGGHDEGRTRSGILLDGDEFGGGEGKGRNYEAWERREDGDEHVGLGLLQRDMRL